MNLKKNKFIIGLSTTLLASVVAAGGEVAHASTLPEQTDLTPTNDIIENVVDEYNQVVDDTELEQPTEENTDSAETNEAEVSKEESAQASDSSQTPQADATDENEASTTNETEQTDTAENTDQATEATSEEEEALLTEPSATTEDPSPVEEAEQPETEPTAEEETPATDQNLDTEVEAGAVVEDEDDADTARTEADPVDEDSTEKAQELEANTESLSNKETAAATNTEQKDDAKTSADSPQETPAGDEPLKDDTQAGDAPLDEDNQSETEEASDLTETEEGATLPLTSEGAELLAGDDPLEEDGLLTEQGSELAETEAGAESSAGVDIAVQEGYTDPQADAANIKNKRETNLTPGDTVESGGKNDFVDPKDGFKAIVIEPSNNTTDKRLYGYELIIDKKTGQRTYTRIEASSAVVRTSPATLGNKLMTGKGYKDPESSTEVIYEPTGPSTLSPGTQNVYGYLASEDDLKFINNKDINSTVLSMKDYYTKDNVYGPKVLDGVAFVFNVNPWPDENDSLMPIRLQVNPDIDYDKDKKVYVHGQEIVTNLKVENLDANARDRLTAKVYNPENGEIVPGAEVYIDEAGNVKVKLPDGAVDTDGKINKKSIFYDDPKFNGAQSLDVKLYARPRTAQEFQDVADLSAYAPGTYTDTGAGTTKITHNGNKVEIANQGIARYDHYNLIGEFEIKLDDESNYDIVTKDITTGKIVTDKMLRLKAGVDKEIEQVDNPNSTAPHKYTTAKGDKAVDSYLEEEYKEFLIPVEGEENKYRTTDNWLVEVDPDNPQNMKVSTPIGAKKGEDLTLAITHLFTNGSEKNFLINYVVREESIEKPDYEVAVTEAGQKVDNTPTNEYTESKPKPVKYELESTSIVDANGKTWTLSIDEDTGVITATAPGEIVDKVSTINAPVIATYVDQKLKDKDGKDLVYTERSNATFTATAPQEGEVTYSQDNTIEYETKVQYNPEKDPTESGVVQEGKNGKYTVDYKVTYKNGEVVEGPTMVEGSERNRVEPIPQIFEIGTKGATVDVTAPDEQTIKIPHTTEIIYDANQPVGYRYETPGEDGEKKITYEITQENGKATVKATETTTKEVTPRRIIIGTKPSELGVDFNPEIDVKVDNTKEVGSVDTEVVQGEYKTVTKNVQNPDGSIVTIEEVVEITKPKQIITVGTKDYTGDVSHTDKKDVPFEVKYEYTDQLDAGVTELKNDGVLGEKTVTYTVPVINGKKDPNKEVTSEETQTKDPVDKVIRVGTKPVEKTIDIPFETEYVYDSSLDAGQTVTDENNPGVTGKKKVTTSFNQTTNNIEVTEETVTEAQKRIVRVGGKTTGTKTVTEKVPFTVEIRENPALKKGEYKVIQDGVVGEKEKILTIENSTVTNTAEGRTITEAKNQIIEVGSADFTGEVTHEVTEEVPFTVRIVEDSTMAPGTHKVVTEGQAGSKTTRYTQNIKNGAADGELKSEEIVTATTKAPVEEVIHVGTAAVNSENTATSGDIPVDITYTYDPTKERGTAEKGTFTPGKVETKIVNQYNPETGKIETKTEETVTNAKQEIIVGTKDYTGTFTHEETKVTPFETQIVHDPTLAAGEKRVTQTGVNGVEKRTITQKFTNGEIAEKSYSDWTTVSEVKNEIIRVGSLTEGTKKHEEAIPFDYKVEYDPTIPAGEYRITQEGKDGKRTTEWTIRNSQVVGEPTVTEEAPVNAIIKVGNKDFTGVATHTESFTIPYKVVIRENSELPVGTRKTVQEGADGSYKITYKQDIKNGNTVGELTRTESDRVEAKDQIIEIGTKAIEPKVDNYSYEVQPEIDYVYDDTLPKGTVEKGKTTPGEVKTVITTTRDPQTGELVTKEEKVVTPARQEIRVGTKDYTGEIKYTERLYEDYKTTIIQDPTLAADQQVVEKQGVVGIKEREVTRTITNGTPSEPSYGEYTTIAEKQDQVIRVGTKTDGTHTVTEEIPFTYTINEVDTLKKGEYEVVTEGKNGSRTTEYRIENSKVVEGSANVTAETPATNAVINVGKGTLNGSHTITETEVVPFETTVEFDDSLAAGEQRVVTEGQNGSKSREVTLTIEDGKVVNTTTGEYKQTQAPVNKVIKVGSLTEGEIVHEEKIPFNYEITYDNTLKAGEVVTDVAGVEGTKSTTYVIKNSTVTKEYTNTTNPTNAKIRVGTKDYTGTVTHTEEEAIPYRVVVRNNPDMLLGTSRTVTEGKAGVKEVTYNIPVINGEQDTTKEVTSSEKVTTQPIDQVIEVGTKPVEAVEKDVSAEVGVEVEIVNDPELDLGKTRTGELVPGKVENVVTTVYNPATGKMETREDKVVTPAKQIIYVGTKDLVGTQEFVVTQVVPFETEYIEDPNLEAGKTEVEQQGQNGQKTVTYKAEAKNGEVTSHKATEEITKEPVKQIIRVGTKEKVVDTKTYTTVTNIPYETIVEFDPELPVGEKEVVTEGQFGEETTTITVTNNNGTVSTTSNTETTKEPVNEVIKVGTKTPDTSTEVVNVETKPIPYETEVIFDNTMELGTSKEENPGKEGTLTITFTTPVTNGVAGETVRTEERTEEPVNRVVRVGTKTNDIRNTVTNTEVRRLDFETEVIFDDTLDFGETEVVTEGEYGEVTITFTNEVVNGVVSPVDRKEVITKQPVTRVVKVGTRNVDTTQNVHIEAIPHETEVVFDDTLELGESVVEKEGKDGQKAVTYTNTLVNGVVTTEKSEKIIENPETRVVRVGTKTSSIVVSKSTKPIAPETEVIFDPELPLGESVVEEEGVDGVLEITHTVPMENGVAGDVVVTEKVLEAPTPRKVRVGTKTDDVETEVVNTEKKVIRHEVEIISDPTLPFGEIVIDEVGEDGELTVTFTTPVVNGVAGKTVREEKITKEPKTQVVRVGSKDGEVVNKTTKVIPHETEVIFDPELLLGDSKVETEGRDGVITVTHTTPVVGGKAGKTVTTEEITTEPITRVVRVGTKTNDIRNTVTNTEVRRLDYETEVIFDDTLDFGETEVVTEGEYGEVTITFINEVVNGVVKPVDRKEVITKEPVTRVVKVGTRTTHTTSNTVEVEIPFETEIITDNTLNAGEKVIDQVGKNGKKTVTVRNTIENGVVKTEVVENIVEEPTKQIVRVGTKCPDKPSVTNGEITETSVIEIPFTTRVVEDPSLDAGQIVEDQKGLPGKKTVTVTIPITNGVAGEAKVDVKETIAPVERVIRVGTKKPAVKPETPKEGNDDIVTVTEVPEQFETEIIYDDTLPAGKVVEDQKGINGVRTITTTIKITDGKAETIVTEEVTKEAQKRIIRIGTKTATNNDPIIDEKIVEIPFETIVTYDPDLEEGKARVIRPGQKGEKTITTITKIVDGKEVTEVVEVITKQPVDEIRVVGRKVNPINPGGTIDIPSNQEDDDKPGVIVPGNEDDTIIDTPDVDEDNTIIDTPDVDEDNTIIDTPDVDEDDTIIDTPDMDEDNTIIDTPDVDEDNTNIDTPDSDKDNATIDTPDTNDEDVNKDPSLDEESDNESDKFKNKTDYDYDIVKDSDDRASSQRKLGGHDSPKTGVTASHDNPKTGIAGTGATLTALGISLAGLRFSKKKKEDDKE